MKIKTNEELRQKFLDFFVTTQNRSDNDVADFFLAERTQLVEGLMALIEDTKLDKEVFYNQISAVEALTLLQVWLNDIIRKEEI